MRKAIAGAYLTLVGGVAIGLVWHFNVFREVGEALLGFFFLVLLLAFVGSIAYAFSTLFD